MHKYLVLEVAEDGLRMVNLDQIAMAAEFHWDWKAVVDTLGQFALSVGTGDAKKHILRLRMGSES